MDFAGKVILVTGAGAGIGEAIARHLAGLNANVMVADIKLDIAEKVANDIKAKGGKAAAYVCDVSVGEQVQAMTEAIVKQHGGLHGAVNNAGIGGENKPLGEMNIARFRKTIDINLMGIVYCMQQQIRVMEKNGGGSIVNMASILGSVGFAMSSDYAASKHAILGLTKSVAWEYGSKNIRVNSVGPGFIETPMMLSTTPPEVLKTLRSKSAFNRFGTVDEVAGLTAFLLSDESSFVTGSYHLVDGGYTAV